MQKLGLVGGTGPESTVFYYKAVIDGVQRLSGAPVKAVDIRAGAALVVAGLGADGETVISDAHHIDRGYERFVERMRSVGADIERVRDWLPHVVEARRTSTVKTGEGAELTIVAEAAGKRTQGARTVARLPRQEPLECEPIGRQPGDGERGDDRARARDRTHLHASLRGELHDPKPGV